MEQMKSLEDLLYGLMAQAEDAQDAATKMLAAAEAEKEASKNMRRGVLEALRGEVREILKEELKGASERLQALSEGVNGAVSSQVDLAYATEKNIRGATWRHSLVLCLVGGIVAGGLWLFQDFALDKAKKERAALLSEIASLTEQAEKLKAKTWGIGLHEDSKGKFIILPKGKEADTNWNFGEQRAVLIIPKRK